MPKTVALHLNKPSKGGGNPYINLTVREDSISVYTDYKGPRGGEQLEEALRAALLYVVQHNKIVAAAERRAVK